MNLKCKINGKVYDKIVSGATFSEEYNETLDSGSIIIDHIPKIENLRPYDDVFIWNADENFNGFYDIGDIVFFPTLGATASMTCEYYASEETHSFQEVESTVVVEQLDSGLFAIDGTIIDLYNYLLMDKGVLSNERYRFSSTHPLIFKIVLTKNDNTNLTGYYELPLDVEKIDVENSAIYLAKSSAYTQSNDLPSELVFNFGRDVLNTARFYTNDGLYPLMLSNVANYISSGEIVPATINSIQTNDDTNYEYIYEQDSAMLSRGKLTISGINEEELKTLSGLKFNAMSEGTKATYSLIKVEEDSTTSGTYNLTFETKLLIRAPGSGRIVPQIITFVFNMSKRTGTENIWESSNTNYDYRLQTYTFDSVDVDTAEAYIVIQTDRHLPSFFKHMLVDIYSAEMVDLENEYYKYKISLMSETKGLEKVILPNISITQPIVGEKRTIWYYLNQYINLYSPKFKKIYSSTEWYYESKYKIDARTPEQADSSDTYLGTPVSAIFDQYVYAPEMSLTTPTLRDILSRLMIVKDCIPVVKNGVIYAMKISETHGNFIADSNHISFINETMDSDSYSTAYRREYENAISQNNSAHRVEFLGFRCKEDALLTLENMYIETQFPIYKINKLYMCYYKKLLIRNATTGVEKTKLILVRQDISGLVLENVVRNTLPADWTKISSIDSYDDMKKYKILTVGFDIGSAKITGWGTKYEYLTDAMGWTSASYTYIETIMNLLDEFYPFGIQYSQFLEANEVVVGAYSWQSAMVSPSTGNVSGLEIGSNIATKLKTLFFQIDYVGMFSGSVVHTKDNTNVDDFVTSDNCSSALSILEVDGLFEKEKINRLGNPTVSFHGRYNSYNEMDSTYNNKLGSLFGSKHDVVIYHREYQIFDECVLCNFTGSYDYVMKNYFTTVFAKYRTYSYASYNQSVNRTENDKYSVLLSLDKLYYENESLTVLAPRHLVTAFEVSPLSKDLTFNFPYQINGGYMTFSDGNQYFVDVNNFVCGFSMCFNMRTFDPFTAGIYISTINCYSDEEKTEYVGSAQDWYTMPVNSQSDGFLEEIGCFFGHFDENDIIKNNIEWTNTTENINKLFEPILKMPFKTFVEQISDSESNSGTNSNQLVSGRAFKPIITPTTPHTDTGDLINITVPVNPNINTNVVQSALGDLERTPTFSFGKKYNFCKDNKENIDYTLQYEFVNYDEDNVLFSEWLMKLAEFGSYIKTNSEQTINDVSQQGTPFRAIFSSIFTGWNANYGIGMSGNTYDQAIKIRIASNLVSTLEAGMITHCAEIYDYTHEFLSSYTYFTTNVTILKIDSIDSNGDLNLLVNFDVYGYSGDTGGPSLSFSANENKILKFEKRSVEEETGFTDYYYQGKPIPAANGNTRPRDCSRNFSENFVNPTTRYEYLVSPTHENTIVFPKTMYVLTCDNPLEKNLVYDQYKLDALPSNYHIKEVNLDEIFMFEQGENGEPYIKYVKPESGLGTGYKSVQYWYYDYYGDKYLHFVFGVNVEDTVNELKTYISILKNRNPNVYDVNNNIAGKIKNLIGTNDYGKGQYYERLVTEEDD